MLVSLRITWVCSRELGIISGFCLGKHMRSMSFVSVKSGHCFMSYSLNSKTPKPYLAVYEEQVGQPAFVQFNVRTSGIWLEFGISVPTSTFYKSMVD